MRTNVHCEEYLDTIENTRPSVFVWLVTLVVAGVDGFLFGYDTGVINGVLVTINNDLGFELGDSHKQLLTSILSAGALISACVAGYVADRWGRKSVLWYSTIVFTIGALLQAVSWHFAQMVVGRFVVGIGVGAAAMAVPLYIAELAPTRFRGRLVVIDVLCITGGQLIAYGIDAVFANVKYGWRFMVGLGALPSFCLFFILPILPETPRHLVRCGRIDEAKTVIRRTFPNGNEDMIQRKINILVAANKLAAELRKSLKSTLVEMYFRGENLRALIVACGIMATQQFCGFNTLMYYSSTIFKSIGWSSPIGVGTTVAATNFLFTCVSLKYIDIVGRRRMLIYTMWGMTVGLIGAAIGFHYLPKDSFGNIIVTSEAPSTGAIVVLVCMLFFVASYATGLGNVPWQNNELFPLSVRALGTTMMTACNWGPNLIVSSTFLSLMNAITPSGAFGLYAAICFVGWIAVILFFPEVSGMPLEDIQKVFKHGFGVRYAEKLRKERKFIDKQNAQNLQPPVTYISQIQDHSVQH
ncbi:unnamed protein product [Didymodactylos carnosus]|uniref:Major facilitator superfamily (MFS) profile domain-containing protein n=2 Tax=Didymodactylos carnosus TaxID=1234261 RepID=A0A814VXE3_9BILA|nr:unnamed protein product [Didymodactylos carnosus]CAF3955469.1 unnamed protein product [Didymodactylos carnosus]